MFKNLSKAVLGAAIFAVVLGIAGLVNSVAMWFGIMLFLLVIAVLFGRLLPRKLTASAIAFVAVLPIVMIGGSLLWSSVIYPAAPNFWDAMSLRAKHTELQGAKAVTPVGTEGLAIELDACNKDQQGYASKYQADLSVIREARLRGLVTDEVADATIKARKAQYRRDSHRNAASYGFVYDEESDTIKSAAGSSGGSTLSLPEFKVPELTNKQWFTIVVVGLITAWVARFLWVWGIQKKFRKPKELGQVLMFFVITAVAFWSVMYVMNHWSDL